MYNYLHTLDNTEVRPRYTKSSSQLVFLLSSSALNLGMPLGISIDLTELHIWGYLASRPSLVKFGRLFGSAFHTCFAMTGSRLYGSVRRNRRATALALESTEGTISAVTNLNTIYRFCHWTILIWRVIIKVGSLNFTNSCLCIGVHMFQRTGSFALRSPGHNCYTTLLRLVIINSRLCSLFDPHSTQPDNTP